MSELCGEFGMQSYVCYNVPFERDVGMFEREFAAGHLGLKQSRLLGLC